MEDGKTEEFERNEGKEETNRTKEERKIKEINQMKLTDTSTE